MDRRASFRNLMTNSLDNQAVAPCLLFSATLASITTETSTTTTRPDASGPGFALEKNRLS